MSQVHPLTRLMARPAVRVGALGYVALTAVHLIAQVVGAGQVTTPSQWLLMPVLALVVWTATASAPRARTLRLVLLALGFSWLGDSVPSLLTGDARFLCMVGFFLCAQVTYVTAFWPDRKRSVLYRPALLGYVAAFAVLLWSCVPGAGGLLVGPVIGYGLSLTLMAVLATGVNRLTGIGGALFLISDSLIALHAFTEWYRPPMPSFWVMATYTVGQALLVAGVLRRERGESTPPDGPTKRVARL